MLRHVVTTENERCNTASKSLSILPQFYTEVPVVTSSIKSLSVPPSTIVSLTRSGFQQHVDQEYLWLDHTKKAIETDSSDLTSVSWAAFHSASQQSVFNPVCLTALLPLFTESAHTVAMIKHSMNMINSAVQHLNPGQAPVIAFDQPLFALAKQIQWRWPEQYGEDKFVIMFGGLHIEMAALKTG